MKKFYLIISSIIVIVIAVNVYFYFYIYNQQLSFHQEMLLKQTQITGWEIEQSGYEFENEINYIVFSTDLANFFEDKELEDIRIKKLELFYFKYQDLIQNMRIYDPNHNVFSLLKDKTNHFISDYYLSQRQRELLSREAVTLNRDGSYNFILPVFKDNEVALNIVIKVDLLNFMNETFNNYHLGSTQWQWIINPEGQILSNNLSRDSLSVTKITKIAGDIDEAEKGTIQHSVRANKKQNRVISAYYPVRLLSHDFGIVFSLETKIILSSIIRSTIIMAVATTSILILIIVAFAYFIRRKNREENSIRKSEGALKKMLEFLPIGIMIIDQKRTVKTLNQTALKIFNIEDAEELEGHTLPEHFLISRNFTDNESFSFRDDLNQYLYYDDNDNEIIIYKKEIPFEMEGEAVSLEAFIDITPIEKARKREVAANKAKSEFLAKMSHEIRTPLNGIIGMADTLQNQKLNSPQEEAVGIIKKSADLLLSIINDILDFSKIEAGKMIIEETPFKLREEMEATLALFEPKAKKKGLEIILRIDGDVPDHIIGDPFRLKQVISNLIGNSIKFTSEGKIVLGIQLEQKADRTGTLQIAIEDTGIGIPEEKLGEIFNSFSQADGSTTRKFGGTGLGTTISKQLVELMGGKIWVESPSSISKDPEWKGAKFAFTIQVYSDEKFRKNIDTRSVLDYKDMKVLIINNNPEKETTLRFTFSNFGTQITELKPENDPIAALENALQNPEERFHLVMIKDSADFNGINMVQRIHQKGLSDKYVIGMVSSNDKPGNYVKSKMNGVDYYLIKPYEASEIFEILQENFKNLEFEEKEMPELNKLKKDINILVAEDNIINQKVAQTIFKNLGYNIILAQDGEDCIKKVKENIYDIIFMDIMMPEKDGMEATSEIRAMGYNLPIVAMTANAREEDKNKAFERGMNDYLPKPVRIEDIKEILIKWFSESK